MGKIELQLLFGFLQCGHTLAVLDMPDLYQQEIVDYEGSLSLAHPPVDVHKRRWGLDSAVTQWHA